MNMELPTACPLLDCGGLWEMTVSLRRAKGSLHISRGRGSGAVQEVVGVIPIKSWGELYNQ